MPRQQVYGKRSRVAYDAFAAFADSPQKCATDITRPDDVESLVGAVSSLKLDTGDAQKGGWKDRRALVERNTNSVVRQSQLAAQVEEKTRRRRKQRTIIEDNENETEPEEPAVDVLTAGFEKLGMKGEVKETVDELDEATTTTTEPSKAGKPSKPKQRRKQGPERCEPMLIPDPDAPREHTQPTPDPPDIYSTHCASILSLADHPLTLFTDWADQLTGHFTISKIAEASFGEVYRLALVHDIDNLSPADESVFKVIPLRGPASLLPEDKRKRTAALRRAEAMSKPCDVANEVRLLQRMSCIPGFTNFRDVRVLRGRPAPALGAAFHAWNAGQKAKKKELSHFPDPEKKASYADDQLWAVIEMQNAGTDLERFVEAGVCSSVWCVWDVFWQVVLSLAKGEEGAEFEHRDLHLGNVCVRRRVDPHATNPSPDGQPHPESDVAQAEPEIDLSRKLNFTPLETTIIDYTLSRARMLDDTVAFYDLAPITEGAVFEGDSDEEYQYDIYRYMRSAMFLDDPLAEYTEEAASSAAATSSETKTWQAYDPVTNLVWLHFLLYKLLEQLEWPSDTKAPAKKRQRDAWMRWKRANDLEYRLVQLQELLDPEVGLCRIGLRSASDIVALAVGEGWLDIEDVVGGGDMLEEEGEVERYDGVGDGIRLAIEEELADDIGSLGLTDAQKDEPEPVPTRSVRRSPRKQMR